MSQFLKQFLSADGGEKRIAFFTGLHTL